MNGFIVKTLCMVALVSVVAARPDTKYTTKYDNVDLDEILKSDRLLNNYIKCLLEQGKCTPDGQELKSRPIYIFFLRKLYVCTSFVY